MTDLSLYDEPLSFDDMLFNPVKDTDWEEMLQPELDREVSPTVVAKRMLHSSLFDSSKSPVTRAFMRLDKYDQEKVGEKLKAALPAEYARVSAAVDVNLGKKNMRSFFMAVDAKLASLFES